MEQSDFLKTALEAVKRAEEIILHYFSKDIYSSLKEDQSSVTVADQEAERIIIETIKSKFPDHSFLGEESGNNEHKSEYLWIIDPIDGTKHFTRHLPLFATQVALLYKNGFVLGVSNAPLLKELMYAQKGKGAYLNNQRVTVSKIDSLNRAFASYGNLKYFTKKGLLENLANLADNLQVSRGFGEFWSYHLLSQGKIEIMIEADTKIWDIAALKVIVEEAGGKVTDIKGNPLTKNSTSIISTNGVLHSEVLRYF